MDMTQRICVVGLGYIGLPTALVFADAGFNVVGVDVNEEVIERLGKGYVHIEEAGLTEMLRKSLRNGRFRVSSFPERADAFIVCVPTPVTPQRKADLSYVVSAIESIVPVLSHGNLVIVESTIPPRTIEDVVAPILLRAGWDVGTDVFLAHCPERVLPGSILKELVHNDRIIGGVNAKSAEKAAELYSRFVKGDIFLTSATNAEMTKLVENTFRDVNIALANELAKICCQLGIDVLEVIRLANRHPRVSLHLPGPGVGGHCIAVDPYFIIERAPGYAKLMSTARAVNSSMPDFVVEHVERLIGEKSKKICVFGIAYKGNVDDTRESPALEVIHRLEALGYEVKVYDPHVVRNLPYITQTSTPEEALLGAELLVILTDHKEFADIDESLLTRTMSSPVVFDTKGIVKTTGLRNVKVYNYGNIHEVGVSLRRTTTEAAAAIE
jgi:UDP-N-acetyl-D-mannosaminuronic acid dehydrogenase